MWPLVSYERWPRQRSRHMPSGSSSKVTSPSDKGDDIPDKIAEYFRIGVECVWVIFISQQLGFIPLSPTQVRILTRVDELYGERIRHLQLSPPQHQLQEPRSAPAAPR